MSRSFLLTGALLLSLLAPAARAQQASVPQTDGQSKLGAVEVLSDTHGADLNPYIHDAIGLIYKNWTDRLPDEVRPPQRKQGQAAIRIKILPDGTIASMWLDSSTHDDAINRACWSAIASVQQFPHLPPGMGSSPLELRIHFNVNTQPDGAIASSAHR